METAYFDEVENVPKSGIRTYHVILNAIRYRPVLWAINLASICLLVIADIIPGLISREFFNELAGDQTAGLNLWTMVALIVAGALAQMLGIFGVIRCNVPFWFINDARFHRNMLNRVLQRPGARSLPESTGEAVNRFKNDVHEIPLFALWLNDTISQALLTAVALVIMLSINVEITLFAFLPLVAVIAVSNMATARIEKYRKIFRKTSGRVMGFIGETFGSVQAIKVAGSEKQVIGHFRRLNEARRKAALKDRLFTEMLISVFRNAGNLGTGVILLLAAGAMRSGEFTVGDFALFVFFLGFFSEFTAFMGMVFARYRQAGVSVDRMQRIMQNAPPEQLLEQTPVYEDGSYPEIPPIFRSAADRLETLEVRGLTCIHPQSGRGIDHVDFKIERGSFTVITGRIGSGKTTLLRALLGLLEKDGGEILWNGTPVNTPDEFFIPPRAAYTAQVPRLFSATLKENLLLGIPEAGMDIPYAIYSAVMDKDLEMLENRLDTLVGPKGVRLSGGQIQRAAAARMFLRTPELFVFDDLSSALDVETEKILWERMFAREDATCLVVSHRHIALHNADHIIVLKDGKIEAEGTLDELLENSVEFQHLWRGDVTEAPPEEEATYVPELGD